MQMLVLTLLTSKKVKLIFGHPVSHTATILIFMSTMRLPSNVFKPEENSKKQLITCRYQFKYHLIG